MLKRLTDMQLMLLIFLACVLVIAVIGMLTGGRSAAPSSRAETAYQARFGCLSSWDGPVPELVDRLRTELRAPDTFEHVSTLLGEPRLGEHPVRMRFRAENGFGGMSLGTVTARVTAYPECAVRDFNVVSGP